MSRCLQVGTTENIAEKQRKIILTTHGDYLQKQTWDLFVLYRYRWLNIQINRNMD